MLAAIRNEAKFSFIPNEILQEVRDDVWEAYYRSAQSFDVVCLDEGIVQMMTFQYLRILYFYELGTLLDEAITGDRDEWRYLHDRYPIDEYQGEFELYRKELKAILMEMQLVFEENWVFSKTERQDYLFGVQNSAIQSVW